MDNSADAGRRAGGSAPAKRSEAGRPELSTAAREAWYRGLIEHSLDKVAVLSPDGTILYESESVRRLLGWRAEELVGTPIADLIHPDDLDSATAQMADALAHPGTVYRLDARLRHRDGSWRHFENLGHARAGARGTEIVVNSRDVTDRRVAEERARSSDQQFRLLAESSPDGFMLFRSVRDEAGGIIDFEWAYTNPSASSIVARSHDALLGLRLAKEMPGAVRSGLFSAWVAVVETGEPWTAEFRYPFDGLDRVFRSQAVKVGDGFGVTFCDVTEANRIRDELREREARFRALAELIPQLVWSARPDGFHDFFNQRWYDYTGMTPDVGHGWTWESYIHPDDYAAARASWLHSLETGEQYEAEIRLRRNSDNSYRWFICRAMPLRDADDRINRWFGTCTDVHDERLAMAALRASEDRFLAVTQATSDVIWEWDLETDALWWNDNVGQTLGLKYDDVPALGAWVERLLPDDRDRVLEHLDNAIRSEHDTWSDEYRFIRGDGSVATIYDRAVLVRDDDGRPVRMIGSMMDITERNALEADLRQAQKMEAVGQLAGGIAHDFNNLLTVITSYSDVLLADTPEDAQARADLEEIRRAAGRASTLTRQLLAFSRRQVLQPRDLDPNGVVADMEKLLGRVIGETIALEFRPGRNVGHVMADPGQMEQVIVNLAVNARDAMPNGGTLTLTTSRRRSTDGEFSVISVADTGTGMDERTVQHIFEPFFTTKPEGQGTGLGLATVHGIVTQSGGRVEVDTAPGRGTTFHVLLPVTRQEEPAAAPVATSHVELRGDGSILVVEDEPAVRSIARRSLERQGFQVHEARNGREALDMLDGEAADVALIITDLVMPVMSGSELARRLRDRPNAPPVLFMSGYAEKDAVPGSALDAGALLLEKPFTMRQLLETVSRALGQA